MKPTVKLGGHLYRHSLHSFGLKLKQRQNRASACLEEQRGFQSLIPDSLRSIAPLCAKTAASLPEDVHSQEDAINNVGGRIAENWGDGGSFNTRGR